MKDDELDCTLRAAVTPTRSQPERERLLTDVWSRVEASMDDHAPADEAEVLQFRRLDLIADREASARRRRRATRLASVTLAVVVAGGGTAAAAEYLSARTGQQLTGWEVNAGGSGEVIDLAGTDLRQVVEQVTADIPFAPGYETERQEFLDSQSNPDPGSTTTTSNLRSWTTVNAICTWTDAWVAADKAGDAPAREQAADVIAGSSTWEPVLTFARDHHESIPMESDGSSSTYFGYIRLLAEAVASGDRGAVFDVMAEHSCSHEVIPVIDADPDYPLAGVR